MDKNGTLRTAVILDYEANSTLTINARVNNGNLSNHLVKLFTVQVVNMVEDFDGDGTEDHFDTDDDGDGFSDIVEIAYGSDPMDANSTANAAPTDLNTTSALQLAENQSIGTVVGQLTATDPDANATLTFTLVAGANDNHLLDTRIYEVEYHDRYKAALAANAIALNLFAQVDDEGNRHVLFDEIINHCTDGTEIKPD